MLALLYFTYFPLDLVQEDVALLKARLLQDAGPLVNSELQVPLEHVVALPRLPYEEGCELEAAASQANVKMGLDIASLVVCCRVRSSSSSQLLTSTSRPRRSGWSRGRPCRCRRRRTRSCSSRGATGWRRWPCRRSWTRWSIRSSSRPSRRWWRSS